MVERTEIKTYIKKVVHMTINIQKSELSRQTGLTSRKNISTFSSHIRLNKYAVSFKYFKKL